MIFSANLQSVCFRSPSNSSLEALSSLTPLLSFSFCYSFYAPFTCNHSFKPAFLSVDALSSELLLNSFLSVVCISSPYLPYSSSPLSFVSVSFYFFHPSRFLPPSFYLSSSIISPSSRSQSLYPSTFLLFYIPQPECCSHFILSFPISFFFPPIICSSLYLPGIWLGVS